MSNSRKCDEGRTRAARLAGVKITEFGIVLDGNGEDALAGVISERALMYSQGSDGKSQRIATAPWHWRAPIGTDPKDRARLGPQPDAEVLVHGDGWTTAHPGSLGANALEDDDERLLRAAGLTEEERAVARAQAAGRSRADVATELRLSFRQVKARVESGNQKLTTYSHVLMESYMGKMLDGDDAIAKHLTDFLGFAVSSDSVRRYRLRESDPLPTKRWGGGGRARVVAKATELEAWAHRQWKTAANTTIARK